MYRLLDPCDPTCPSIGKKAARKGLAARTCYHGRYELYPAFVLNIELYNTLLGFTRKLEKAEDKTKKIAENPKDKLVMALEDVKRTELWVLVAEYERRLSEDTRKIAEERALATENKIAVVNRDYDAMVVGKGKLLTEA
ncbi:hypothetical protein Adt_21017 [Abeliophyllum distichum]|uniref:Uncharacterized protein n=1 Tax=Abeliophyllum distichum TaxID=126358 RepID=A0ABD1SY51_9LAMI